MRRENSENVPPTTPRKQEKTSGTSHFCPKQLIQVLPITPVSIKRTVSLFTPKTIRTTTPGKTPASITSTPTSTVFSKTKAVLRRGAVPGKLTARSSERAQILSFLSHNLRKLQKGAFLYICGPPGTGKTALMNEIFSEYRECPSKPQIDLAFINCMSFEKADDVFDRILEEFDGTTQNVDAQLEYLFIKRKTMSYEHIFDKATNVDLSCWTKWII